MNGSITIHISWRVARLGFNQKEALKILLEGGALYYHISLGGIRASTIDINGNKKSIPGSVALSLLNRGLVNYEHLYKTVHTAGYKCTINTDYLAQIKSHIL